MGLRDYLRDLFTDPAPVEVVKVSATKPVGVSGTAIYGGYITSNERSSDLVGTAKWRNYDTWKRNIAAVAAGLRNYLVLVGSPDWGMDAYKAPGKDEPSTEDAERAKWALAQLTGMATPWSTVTQIAALATFDGFELQEWVLNRDADGRLGLRDIAWRPGHTIERWNRESGVIVSVVQRAPEGGDEIEIPRERLVYTKDLPLTDSPEGVGVMRQLAETIRRMLLHEELRDKGHEKSVDGVPVAYGPILEKKALIGTVPDGWTRTYTAADFDTEFEAIQTFAAAKKRKHAALILDSSVYQDQEGKLSGAAKYRYEILRVGAENQAQLSADIKQLSWDLLSIMGFEYLALGADGAGSLAMHASKMAGALRLVTSVLNRWAITARREILMPLWAANGWDPETAPTLTWDALEFADHAAVVQSLSALLTGAAVEPGRADGIVDAVLANMGLPPLAARDDEDVMLRREEATEAAGLGKKPAKDDEDIEIDLDEEDD
jgi:hypothetical protein